VIDKQKQPSCQTIGNFFLFPDEFFPTICHHYSVIGFGYYSCTWIPVNDRQKIQWLKSIISWHVCFWSLTFDVFHPDSRTQRRLYEPQRLCQPAELKSSYDPQQTWPPPRLRLLTSTKWRHSTGGLLAAMFVGEHLLGCSDWTQEV